MSTQDKYAELRRALSSKDATLSGWRAEQEAIDLETLSALLADRDDLAFEVERLTSDRDSWADQAHNRVDDVLQAYKERDALAQRVAELERDAARFEWYFGDADKMQFIPAFMEGCRKCWSTDQWRSAIDAAIGKENKHA